MLLRLKTLIAAASLGAAALLPTSVTAAQAPDANGKQVNMLHGMVAGLLRDCSLQGGNGQLLSINDKGFTFTCTGARDDQIFVGVDVGPETFELDMRSATDKEINILQGLADLVGGKLDRLDECERCVVLTLPISKLVR